MRAILALMLLFPLSCQNAAAAPKDRAIATGFGPVSGAIVCPDFRAVQAAFRSFTARRGPPPEYFGCTIVRPGTVMTLEGTDPGGAPVVSALLPDGRPVRGVTLHEMAEIFAPKPRKAAVSPPGGSAPKESGSKGGIPLPPIQNSPDTLCEAQRQCSDEEFSARLAILQKQWALMPDSLRKKCTESATLTAMKQCISSQTTSWSNSHPKAETPWMDPELTSQ